MTIDYRTITLGLATIVAGSIAAAVITATPAQAPGQPSVAAIERAAESIHPSREGVRLPLRRTEPIAKPKATPTPRRTGKPAEPITIRFYKNCTGYAQRCIDRGHLTMYGGKILAGHNYMNYQWLSRVPKGKVLRVTGGPLAGTYRVYGHMKLNRQGGAIPDFGRADLVLQSCEGSGTGFSLLHRV